MSASMARGIETGDVVIVTPYEGGALRPGTVIVFDDPASDGQITHRIVDVTAKGAPVTLTIKTIGTP
jgi:hypothetical protein